MTIPHNHVRASDPPAKHAHCTSDAYWHAAEVEARDSRLYDRFGKCLDAVVCRHRAAHFRHVARTYFENGL